jgi:hypothetical protein
LRMVLPSLFNNTATAWSWWKNALFTMRAD